MEPLAAKSAIPPARFLLVKTIAVRGLLIGRPALEAETSEAARSERPARGPLGTGSPARFVHANRGPHRTLPTHNRSKITSNQAPKPPKNLFFGSIADSGAEKQARDMHARRTTRQQRHGGGGGGGVGVGIRGAERGGGNQHADQQQGNRDK